MLDKAIVRWYTSHDYELPEVLNADVLSVMGLRDIDLSKFTYTKLADNKYSLVVALSGKTEKSINSDRDLPLKPAQNAPSSSGGTSTTTPSTPDSGSTGDSGDSGTTTPDTDNTGDSGNSGSSSSGTSGGSSGDSGTTTPDTGDSGDSGNSGTSGGNVSGSTSPNEFGFEGVTDQDWSIKTIDFGNNSTYNISITQSVNIDGSESDYPDCTVTASGKQKIYFNGGGADPSNFNSIENGSGHNGGHCGGAWLAIIDVATGKITASFNFNNSSHTQFDIKFTKKS